MTYFCKIKFMLTKKQMLILLMLFAIKTLIFMLSYKNQDLTPLNVLNKNSERLTKTLQQTSMASVSSRTSKIVKNMKYVLEWNMFWYNVETEGQSLFIKANCEYTNCYITARKDYLDHYTKFDVIIFGPKSGEISNSDLPQLRSPHQKYIFSSLESSAYYPVCTDRFDGYFNWTWTFRLDSDIFMGFFVIRDVNGTIVGPKSDTHWMKLENMDPVPQDVRKMLKSKKKLAAMLASNCYSKNDREHFVGSLNNELKGYGRNYHVDIYGHCGNFDRECYFSNNYCQEMFQRDYFFYLAFENSDNLDYVTEKLLRALEYNMVPVVYGGANYTRFLPDGIYLNAKDLGVKELAAKMVELVNDFEQYTSFFKWKNHYTYTSRCAQPDSNDYCNFCAIVNNESEMRRITVKRDFQEWWDPPDLQC